MNGARLGEDGVELTPSQRTETTGGVVRWASATRRFLAGLAIAGLLVAASTTATTSQTASFQGLGFVPGGANPDNNSWPYAVNADGSVVVGRSCINGDFNCQAFRWANGVMSGLGSLVQGGNGRSYASGVSADGNTVVGTSAWLHIDPSGLTSARDQAFKWVKDGSNNPGGGTMTGLGFLGDYESSWAEAMTPDATVAVGNVSFGPAGCHTQQPARWVGGSIGGSGNPSGLCQGEAYAVSANGAIAVGAARAGPNGLFQAFRGSSALGNLPGGTWSMAYGVNANGSVVVGFGNSQAASDPANSHPAPTTELSRSNRIFWFYNLGLEAFRWVNGTMTGLGFLPGMTASRAFAVSGDGSVVVGESASNTDSKAIRWTTTAGMQSIRDLLSAHNVFVGNWTLLAATAISSDGTVIVGYGNDPAGQRQGWIARIPLAGPSTPTCALSASPSTINAGQTSTLSWSSTNATGGTITGIGTVGTSGSQVVGPSQTTTYVGTFTGPNGSATCQTTVTVVPPTPPPTCSLSASPSTINQGQTATLSWASTNATAGTIDNGVGGISPVATGSVVVAPASTTTYTGTFANPSASTTCQTTITVIPPPPPPPPTCSLSASPSTINQGQGATLIWTSTNATAGTIDNGVGGISPVAAGSVVVTPASTTTYTGTFAGPSGSTTCQVQITVVTAGAACSLPSEFGEYNGDGRSDMLFRRNDGTLSQYQMNGFQITAAQIIGQVGTESTLIGLGDFNGDRKTDMLFRHRNGTLYLFLMDSFQVLSFHTLGTVGNEWTLAGVGDVNGDCKSDMILRRTDGMLSLYLMNGAQVQSAQLLGMVGTEWVFQGLRDFNGDGRADMLFRRADGMLSLYLLNGFNLIGAQVIGQIGPDFRLVGLGDFNGDRRADMLLRRTDGMLSLYLMNGFQVQAAQLLGIIGNEWTAQGVGDFNNDARFDMLFRRTDGTLSLYLMNGFQMLDARVLGLVGTEWGLCRGRGNASCGRILNPGEIVPF